MLDEKDLQAIAKLMDEKISASESRTADRADRQSQELQGNIRDSESRLLAMMEAYFGPKFDLLADGQKLIREQMVTRDDLADLESRLDVLEAVTRRNVREIDKLKKAQ